MAWGQKTRKIAVEKREFSTLSTGLSTGQVVRRWERCISILVNISLFDSVLQISYFFAGQNVDYWIFCHGKLGLDRLYFIKKGKFKKRY